MHYRSPIALATLLFVLSPVAAVAGPCDAHFTFDGTLVDASGNGYDGVLIEPGATAQPGQPTYGDGRFGQALRLDGQGAIRAPLDLAAAGCPKVTITAWVKFDDNPIKGNQYIISTGLGGPALIREGVNLDVRGGGQRYRASKALRGGSWEFIAATIDQQAGKMTVHWRNRVYEKDIGTSGTRQADIWIGAVDDNIRNPVMSGLIDEVHIVGQVLTADQILQIRDNVGQVGVMPKPTGLLPGQPGLQGQVDAESVRPKLFDEDAPPDIGDGTGAEVTAGQQVLMADSGPDLNTSGTPTSVMPGGGSPTGLSQATADELQQAREQSAPLDITYGSEAEGERAAAAAEALRQKQAAESATQEATTSEVSGGYRLSATPTTTVISGYQGESVVPIDLVTEEIVRIDILKGDIALASKPLGVRIWGRSGRNLRAGNGSQEQIVADLGNSAVLTMKACRNLSNKRVVGLEVDGNELLPDGEFGSYRKDTDKRDSCNNTWGRQAKCPANSVATGVYMHYKPATMDFDSLPDKVIGLQLICREIVKL